MGSHAKVRFIDYNLKEIQKMTGIKNDNTFDNAFNNVLIHYGFEKNQFKIDHNDNSNYYFPYEIGSLMALLIKSRREYPLSRSNAKLNTSARDFKKYNEFLINEIEELPEIFLNMVKTLPSYLEAKKIVDYTEMLVEQFYFVILNIANSNYNGLGSAFGEFCKELDILNVNLFNSNEQLNSINKSLVYSDERVDTELASLFEELHKEGRSLDNGIASLIKRFLADTKVLNYQDKNTHAFDFVENKDLLLFLGIEIKNNGLPDASSIELERFFYDEYLESKMDIKQVESALQSIEKHEKNMINFKDSKDKVLNGKSSIFKELTLEDRKNYIKRQLDLLNTELAILETYSEEDFKKLNKANLEINNKYIEFYNNNLKSKSDPSNPLNELYESIDYFVGKVILQHHHFNK